MNTWVIFMIQLLLDTINGDIYEKVDLRINEEQKYQIIKKRAEGAKPKERASIEIGCTVRHVSHLILKYKNEGKAAFIHGNRGRNPSATIPLEVKEKVVNCYVDHYCDTNFTHFCEIIEDDLGIKISDTPLNKWLREINIISPKARKRTRKQLKK